MPLSMATESMGNSALSLCIHSGPAPIKNSRLLVSSKGFLKISSLSYSTPVLEKSGVKAASRHVYELWPERHAGLFIEGAYAYDFGSKEDAVRATSGLHIGVP
jgi:hypothetical protein